MHQTLSALAEPHRLSLLEALRRGEATVGQLVAASPLGQPAISKHLAVLRQAGLVKVRKDAQRRLYSLNPEPLAELDAWLEPFRAFWSGRLDALERHLDEEC